jgi:hypothetical protein
MALSMLALLDDISTTFPNRYHTNRETFYCQLLTPEDDSSALLFPPER